MKEEFGASLEGDRARIHRTDVEPGQVSRALVEGGIKGATVEQTEPTLEDAFVRAASDASGGAGSSCD